MIYDLLLSRVLLLFEKEMARISARHGEKNMRSSLRFLFHDLAELFIGEVQFDVFLPSWQLCSKHFEHEAFQ